MQWNQWILVGCGAWLIVAPWALGFSAFNIAAWNSVLIGCFVVIFTVWGVQPPEA
jgi:hypothetical protein